MESRGTVARIGFCCAVAGTGAALSVGACGDSPRLEPISITKLSVAFCENAIACECGPYLAQFGIVAPVTCEGWHLSDYLLPDDGGGEYGDLGGDLGGEFGDIDGGDTFGGDIAIEFDQLCLNRFAEAISTASCDAEVPPLTCDQYCNIFYGTRFEFEPCDSPFVCAQGLTCFHSECRDPCQLEVAGEGENCEFKVCDVGLDCVVNEEFLWPVCVAALDQTDPCGDLFCNSTSWCDQNDPDGPRCRPQIELGDPCSGHLQCASRYCPAGFCEQLPGEGEPCMGGECRLDLECVPTQEDPGGTCLSVSPACRMLGGIFEGLPRQ